MEETFSQVWQELGSKLLPLAIKGVSKVAPALATGAANALGRNRIKKTDWTRYFNSKKSFSHFFLPLLSEFTQGTNRSN